MAKKKKTSSEFYYRNPLIKEPTWLCVECNKTFATNYSLRRHMRIIHQAPKTLIRKMDNGVMKGYPFYDED